MRPTVTGLPALLRTRRSLLSAYQAWGLTWLVVSLGALFTGLGVVFGATAYTMRPIQITIPESPEVLQHKELTNS